MTNPDYAALLAAIAAETDPVLKQALIDQAYVFTSTPTDGEIELFEFFNYDYVEPNPGNFQDTTAFYFTPGYVDADYIVEAATSYVDIYYVDDNYFEEGSIPSSPTYSSYVGVYYNEFGEST
jgi:hypothetical protein